MQGNASVFSATWPCYFLLRRGLASCLRITCCLPRYLPRRGRWAPFLYRKRSGALLNRYLACLFFQNRTFFLCGCVNNRFHDADVQRDPTIPSSILLAPSVSSPCLDVNEGINLQATGSSSCLTLQLCQTNQIWKGELSELLVAKGY